MITRFCVLIGAIAAWLIVCTASQLMFNFDLWFTFFTTIWLAISTMQAFRGLVGSWVGGKWATSPWLSALLDVVWGIPVMIGVSFAIHMIHGFEADVAFIPLMVATLVASVLAPGIALGLTRLTGNKF